MATFITGVQVYMDGEDITQYLFGVSAIDIDENSDVYRNLDLSPFLKTKGDHKLEITCDQYSNGRVEARLEII
jgi:hypothetical protein